MSYETMMYISIGVGLVFLTISIILFFMFRIPSAISELSGRTARREIQEIMSRESNSLPKGRKIKSTAKKTEKLEDWKVPVTKGGTGNGLDERIVMNSTVRDIPVRDGPVQENSVRSYEIAQKSAAEKPEVQSAGAGNTVLLARGPIRGKDTMPLGDHPPGAEFVEMDVPGSGGALRAGVCDHAHRVPDRHAPEDRHGLPCLKPDPGQPGPVCRRETPNPRKKI